MAFKKKKKKGIKVAEGSYLLGIHFFTLKSWKLKPYDHVLNTVITLSNIELHAG